MKWTIGSSSGCYTYGLLVALVASAAVYCFTEVFQLFDSFVYSVCQVQELCSWIFVRYVLCVWWWCQSAGVKGVWCLLPLCISWLSRMDEIWW